MKKFVLFCIALFLAPIFLTSVWGAKYESFKLTDPEIATHAHSKAIFSLAINQTGQYLASSSLDDKIKIWHIATGELINTLEADTQHPGTCTAFDPTDVTNTSLAIVTLDQDICFRDIQTGEIKKTFENPTKDQNQQKEPISTFIFNKEKQLLAAGTKNGTIIIWALEENPAPVWIKKKAHKNEVESLAFSPTDMLMSYAQDKEKKGYIRFWTLNIKKEKMSQKYEFPTKIGKNTNKRATFYSKKKTRLTIMWELFTDIFRKEPIGYHKYAILPLFHSQSPNSSEITCPDNQNNVLIYDSSTKLPRLIETLALHTSKVTSVVFSPANNSKGKTLVSAGQDGTIIVSTKTPKLFNLEKVGKELLDVRITCIN